DLQTSLFIYNIPWGNSLLDALGSNIFLAGFGLTYWYMIQYLSPSHQGITGSILSQIFSVILGVTLLVYASTTVLQKLLQSDAGYLSSMEGTIFWRILFGCFYMALVIMVYYLLWYNNDLKEKEREELQLQNMLKASELEMLKFQINPHFIFNSLNSISSLTITEPTEAREMVIKLSDFLRSSLGKNNPEEHTLEEELKQMQLYLDIEKVRFGDRLSIAVNIEEGCGNMTLPNLILQPLYENAIKYGIYEQLDNVEIVTSAKNENDNLHISITNQYDCESTSRKGKGIGLMNVRNRLELIYSASDLVTIEKDKSHFTVHLVIPQAETT
ncbi:MAG: histidine kinase, partial [Bacteroidota bacterium]